MIKLKQLLRTWMLAIDILLGVLLYFLGDNYLPNPTAKTMAMHWIKTLQPILIFVMLMITFCKVEPRSLRLTSWHGYLLILQTLGFSIAAIFITGANPTYRPIAEGALLCFICPTATAAAVITDKLKGDVAGVISYTILANILAALLIPTAASLILPSQIGFLNSLWRIMVKVFPMLIFPFFVAWGIRTYFPLILKLLLTVKDLAFYIWAVCLTLAITTSTHALLQSTFPYSTLLSICIVSLVSCALQFGIGRIIGRKHHSLVAASQAIGQKNTVFAIWAGFTFFDPISSLAGGFYSIFHNLWNSYQLSRQTRREQSNQNVK